MRRRIQAVFYALVLGLQRYTNLGSELRHICPSVRQIIHYNMNSSNNMEGIIEAEEFMHHLRRS